MHLSAKGCPSPPASPPSSSKRQRERVREVDRGERQEKTLHHLASCLFDNIFFMEIYCSPCISRNTSVRQDLCLGTNFCLNPSWQIYLKISEVKQI